MQSPKPGNPGLSNSNPILASMGLEPNCLEHW